MFESSFYGEDEVKYDKISVLERIGELLAVEKMWSRRQYLLELEEAVECDEADEGAVCDLMNYEY